MEKLAMLKRHYLTGVVVLLSVAAGSAAASAAETGIKTMRNLYTRLPIAIPRIVSSMGFAGSTIMPDRLQATATTTVTPGMTINGIRIPGVPGMATIEAA